MSLGVLRPLGGTLSAVYLQAERGPPQAQITMRRLRCKQGDVGLTAGKAK